MKRRRIRELVAAALTDYCGEPTRPDEITVSVRCAEDASKRVEVGVLWAFVQAASKREALRRALAVHGWERPWSFLGPGDRACVRDSLTLDVLARPALMPWRSASDRMAHLREPVTLPEEAPRG